MSSGWWLVMKQGTVPWRPRPEALADLEAVPSRPRLEVLAELGTVPSQPRLELLADLGTVPSRLLPDLPRRQR